MSEAKCRKVVRERSGEICEICGKKRAAQMHHRRNRSQSGKWEAANILHICLDDHVWIGLNIAAAERNGWTIQGTQAIPAKTPVRRRGERVFLYDDGRVVREDDVDAHLEVVQ